MTLLSRNSRMQKRATAVISGSPKLLLKARQILAAGRVSIPDQLGLTEAGTDEVHDDACARHGDQACELANGFDLQELGESVPVMPNSARTQNRGARQFSEPA